MSVCVCKYICQCVCVLCVCDVCVCVCIPILFCERLRDFNEGILAMASKRGVRPASPSELSSTLMASTNGREGRDWARRAHIVFPMPCVCVCVCV
jgi:hypothetical protein